jgi:hypothetical protein
MALLLLHGLPLLVAALYFAQLYLHRQALGQKAQGQTKSKFMELVAVVAEAVERLVTTLLVVVARVDIFKNRSPLLGLQRKP